MTPTREAPVPHRQLAAVVEGSTDAIFCSDLEGVVTTWNPAAERTYGYRADEIVGRRVEELLPPLTREHLTSVHAEAAAGRRVERYDTQHLRRDGDLIAVSVSVWPLHDDTGAVTAVATTVTDVGERVRLAAELESARAELQRRNAALARSNRDLEQFAYVASHDLSEPLRVMTGFVQQLERKYDGLLDDRGRRYVQHIVEASVRMRALIDDLLDYSRFLRAPRELGRVDTTAVAQRAVAAVATPLRESGGEVTVKPLPAVWSDEALLLSLLQNLIANAVKFSAPGRPPHVEVHGSTADGWVTLHVDDDGIGIAPEYRERVFRMFQRLHVREAYSGTGIGLAIAQQVVELHNGRIAIEDSPLGGARFTCTLPADATTAGDA